MIAGTLYGWSPTAGDVVEWHLCDEAAARASAPADPVGPSFLQRDHLIAAKAKRAAGHPHRAVVMMTTEVPETLDRAAMTAAIADFVRAHDEMRSFFDVSDDGTIVRHVVTPEAIDFTSVDVGGWPGTAEIIDRVQHRTDTEATFDSVPGLAFGAVDAGTSFSFYLVSDHSHTDGSASIGALAEIFERYRAHRDQRPAVVPVAGSHREYITDEYRRAAAVDPADPRVDHWRGILRAHDRSVPRCRLDLGLESAEPAPAIAIDRPLVSAEVTAACETRARSAGGSLLGVLFAALARAEFEITGDADYFTSTVLSTRDPARPGTQGWLCNFAPVSFSAREPDPDRLVVVASDALRRARDLKSVPTHAVLGALAAQGDFIPDGGSPQMVSYLDFRRLADESCPEIAGGAVIPGVGRTRNANLWINRNPDGLRLLSHLPDNDIARRSVTELHDRVVAVLEEYGAPGGAYAPTTAGTVVTVGDR